MKVKEYVKDRILTVESPFKELIERTEKDGHQAEVVIGRLGDRGKNESVQCST